MSTVIVEYQENQHVEGKVVANGATFATDNSKEYGGLGEEPSPIDLLCGSLGSCMLTMMGLYAKKHDLDITGTTVLLDREFNKQHRISKISIEVSCPHLLEEKDVIGLEKAAMACPVYHALSSEIEKEHAFKWPKK